jgi:predicted nucleic acid-binding protein
MQPFDQSVFDRATDLRVTHRPKTPDALHLAAALSAGCAEFLTNDRQLLLAAAGNAIRILTIADLGA